MKKESNKEVAWQAMHPFLCSGNRDVPFNRFTWCYELLYVPRV